MADLETCYAWVVDEPTLDEPREAFAVAVERTDPDRAEFIRVQLAMARARAAWADSYPLSLRSAALAERHHQRWAQPVRQLVAGYQFLRGFVDLVTMDAGIFLAFSADLYRRAPVLHLDLTGVRDVADELFDDPQLERIVSLSLRGCALGDRGVALLARSPYLRRLEWLDLSDNGIGEEGLDALAASTSLPRLGYVGLAGNAIDDPTPAHADEYDATSEVGRALQDRHGPRDWLEAQARWRWPPDRDAVRRPAAVTRSRTADGQDGRMDLHPYDGKKRRFRHDDAGDQAFARGEVERLLRMPIGAHSLRYDLAFYSGGIGIVDNLFISIEAADAWRAKVPDGFLLAEDALEGDIRWLIMADDDLTPDAALTRFIADHRAPFQAPAREEMWIERGSDVNSWTVAYTCQGWLHWMSHDEG